MNSNLQQKQILVIGAGSMAEAMIRGLIEGGAILPAQISVTNRCNTNRLSELQERYGVRTLEEVSDAPQVIRDASLVVIAVKPHDVLAVLHLLKHQLDDQVLLSVAAGISTRHMEAIVGPRVQVVRAMPNTACAVLESATAVTYGQACTEEGREMARTVLSVLGTVSVVAEDLMDVVTGVSGSGPAYFYYMVEGMQDAAEALGLPKDIARQLVLQTLYGAGRMLQETGMDASELRRQVTSPNGTTMAGLRVFEQAEFTSVIRDVITSAAVRSGELGGTVLPRKEART